MDHNRKNKSHLKPTNEDETQIAVGYGLSKGNYRLVLKAPKEQLNTNVVYDKKLCQKRKLPIRNPKQRI